MIEFTSREIKHWMNVEQRLDLQGLDIYLRRHILADQWIRFRDTTGKLIRSARCLNRIRIATTITRQVNIVKFVTLLNVHMVMIYYFISLTSSIKFIFDFNNVCDFFWSRWLDRVLTDILNFVFKTLLLIWYYIIVAWNLWVNICKYIISKCFHLWEQN